MQVILVQATIKLKPLTVIEVFFSVIKILLNQIATIQTVIHIVDYFQYSCMKILIRQKSKYFIMSTTKSTKFSNYLHQTPK